MKPRNQVYRILARCKAAKHGPSEKAMRKRENEKVAKELDRGHIRIREEIAKFWEQFYDEDY